MCVRPLHFDGRTIAELRFQLQSEPAAAFAIARGCLHRRPEGRYDRSHQQRTRARASEKKLQELDQAPFGIVGLETTLGLIATKLIEPGHLSWPAALAKLTCNPARVLGIQKGTLRIGADADVSIIDPHYRWEVRADEFQSKSSNTPFDKWMLTGRVDKVIVGGTVKLDRQQA